jgi:gamma-glutamyltranspeptidase/glutathione hydrolase
LSNVGYFSFYDLVSGLSAFGLSVVQSKGGVLALEDLAAHTSTLVEPISYTYRSSVTLHEIPPNGQGLTALIALGILDQLQELGTIDLNKVEYGSADWFHPLIEAMRLAFADTRAYVADTEKAKVPVKELLSKVTFLACFFCLRGTLTVNG